MVVPDRRPSRDTLLVSVLEGPDRRGETLRSVFCVTESFPCKTVVSEPGSRGPSESLEEVPFGPRRS